MEQTALSQCGSNSASFFLYRRAKFIEKDREERMMKEEQERKKALEAQQVMEANKAEVDKKQTIHDLPDLSESVDAKKEE